MASGLDAGKVGGRAHQCHGCLSMSRQRSCGWNKGQAMTTDGQLERVCRPCVLGCGMWGQRQGRAWGASASGAQAAELRGAE